MTVHVRVLGINEYAHPIQNLRCAEKDARDIHALLSERFGFSSAYIEERSAEGILGALRTVQPATGDTFIFFFAGHGKAIADDHLLLLPSVDLEAIEAGVAAVPGALSVKHLTKMTAGWQGVRRLFIIDACRSPLVTQRSTDVERYQGDYLVRDVKLVRSKARTDEARLAVLNSCDVGSSATELVRDGNGHFTSALIKVLREALGQSASLSVDASLCERVRQKMEAEAKAIRLPAALSHRPAFRGDPVELALPTVDATERRNPAAELTQWRIAEAIHSLAEYRNFVELFPNSSYAARALEAIRSLGRSQTAHPGHVQNAVKPLLPSPAQPSKTATVQSPTLIPQAVRPTTPSKPGVLDGQARQDARLWQVAEGIGTLQGYMEFLVKASASAPFRNEAQARYGRLKREHDARNARHMLTSAPAAEVVKRSERTAKPDGDDKKPPAKESLPAYWQPDPEPVYRLSLDPLANLLGRRRSTASKKRKKE